MAMKKHTAKTELREWMDAQGSLAVVRATAILAPDELVNVLRAALRAEPHNAVVIASTAVTVAPDQVEAIRAAVLAEVPGQPQAIAAATKAPIRSGHNPGGQTRARPLEQRGGQFSSDLRAPVQPLLQRLVGERLHPGSVEPDRAGPDRPPAPC